MKRKILIVDDEAEIRRVLESFFEKKGFETVSVESGLLGLNILAKEDFDCLISDIRMPLMDGVEFARKARELNRDLAIILLTGYGSLATAQEAIKSGIQGYLTKPMDLDKVEETVEHALSQTAVRKFDSEHYHQLEAELRQDRQKLDSMKENLTTLISHELRTPVAVISESFSLLKDALIMPTGEKFKTFSDEDKKRLFEFLEKGRRRLITVIEDISYYMSLKNRAVSLKLREVVLNEFLEDNLTGFSRLISGTKSTLKNEFSRDKIRAEIDKERFLDCLARLVHNASHHNPQGAEIVLKLSGSQDSAIIEVRDNGTGFKKELLDNIFDPFSAGFARGHTRGIGLGIAICKEVLELHKGNIYLENQEGMGAVATVKIPRAEIK